MKTNGLRFYLVTTVIAAGASGCSRTEQAPTAMTAPEGTGGSAGRHSGAGGSGAAGNPGGGGRDAGSVALSFAFHSMWKYPRSSVDVSATIWGILPTPDVPRREQLELVESRATYRSDEGREVAVRTELGPDPSLGHPSTFVMRAAEELPWASWWELQVRTGGGLQVADGPAEGVHRVRFFTGSLVHMVWGLLQGRSFYVFLSEPIAGEELMKAPLVSTKQPVGACVAFASRCADSLNHMSLSELELLLDRAIDPAEEELVLDLGPARASDGRTVAEQQQDDAYPESKGSWERCEGDSWCWRP